MTSVVGGTAPILTIVTAVFNGSEHLAACLESVASQDCQSIQHIVIDGGSTDGSVEILRSWSRSIDQWISEPDRGIADAMNKGLQLATGEWILFLHSDDELLDGSSISSVLSLLAGTKADIVAFPIRYGQRSLSRVIPPRGATPWLRFKNGLPHQGVFIRRHVFDEVGLYDTSYRISMDYDFFLRAWLKGVAFITYRSPVPTLMRDGGISSRTDWPGLRQRIAEERRIHEANGSNPLWRFVYWTYWLIYPIYLRGKRLLQASASR